MYGIAQRRSAGAGAAQRGRGDDDDGVEVAERNYLDDLNPESKRILRAYVEPALARAAPEERFQFERHGYFVADLADHGPGKPVFNRAVTLRDSWSEVTDCADHGSPGLVGGAAAPPFRRVSRAAGRAKMAPPTLPQRPAMKRIVLFLATNLAVMRGAVDRAAAARARPRLAARRRRLPAAARVLGGLRLRRRVHLAADVEVDGQVVDRRAGHRRSREAKPRPGWSPPCSGSRRRPASACPRSRSTKARPTPSPPARSGTPRWSPCPPACCSR